MKKVLYVLFAGIIALSLKAQQLDVATVWASPAFYQKNVDEVASMNDGEHYSVLEKEDGNLVINKYSFKTFKKVATILAGKEVMVDGSPLEFDSYEFNSDETKLLLTTGTDYIYRRSFTATYYIYDLKNKAISLLADTAKGPQQLADISPDGQKVAFVRHNNIFYKDLKTGEEVQVTNDGKRNAIINGTTDWVYEEEFSITKGFYWSPNSTEIAYYKFDESNVKEFQFDKYGSLYPERYTYKYPKAGEDNSKISIHLYSLATKTTKNISTGTDADIYLPRMAWDPKKGYLVVLRMNRHQNKLEYCMVDVKPAMPELKPFYTETSTTYVEITDDLIFLNNQEGFIRTSEKDGYNHIWKVDYAGKETQITKGNWDVIELKGLDEKGGWVYYASAESGPTQKEIFRIKLDGSGKTKLSKRKGTNDATFSKGMKYFMNYNSSANVPLYITLHTADGKELKVLEDNAVLVANLAKYNLSKKEFLTFKTSQGNELNAWMIKPANFDANKKYPVYLTFYGGPGHNEVLDAWGSMNYGWHQLLAQKGYLVFCVDPRGTMYRGATFKKCTYMQLGKYETEDLIETAKYLAKYAFVDPSRIGVQGWSYGGYMTLLCMTKGADYFKAGISVAPVTNWRYYDNIYTERFMRKPQENANGYDDNSPINHVTKLKGRLLLVHGTADDNVHYQNSLEITNAFIKANKQFDMFFYPNKNHGIAGGLTRYHLYTKMLNFIEANF
ncbi:MAG TPA: S9 family peptidase [Flavobacteriales bacterium]|nr:S9 family peptidase [Flavobacteriales bacterium]